MRGANSYHSCTNDQTDASLEQAWATLTSTRAKLEQTRANLWRDQLDYDRTQKLLDRGVASALDRYHVDTTLQASKANVKALEDFVKA